MPAPEHREHAARIARFAQSGLRAIEDLPTRLRVSWQRSLETHGLTPDGRSKIESLSHADLRERRGRLEPFLHVARSYAEPLHRQLLASEFCVLLADGDGATIDFYGDAGHDREFKRMSLCLGTCWSERIEGTSGIGTALYDRAPILVHRNDHFRAQNIGISCSAAPVFDADGAIIAVVNATGLRAAENRASQALIYGLVVQAAAMIENSWFLAQHDACWTLELGPTPTLFTSAQDQIIAFNDNGAIIASNRAARADLLRGRTHETLSDLFDIQPESLIRGAHEHPGVPQILHTYGDGTRRQYYARVRAPLRQHPARAKPSAMIAPPPAAPTAAGISTNGLAGLRCSDPQMATNIERARRLVNRRIPILILGETGSGKEVFARAIHAESTRRDKPLVALNCAAIPETLIESELFGYRAGAFTGAKAKGEKGKILLADGGTLFLDEIGDMPIPLQTRLLRVLAEGEVVPLGSTDIEHVDLSVICATHRDLPTLVRQGLFREDLYYRLNAATLRLPPLRERCDRTALIQQLFSEERTLAERPELTLPQATLECLSEYAWPGNIRQLRNALRYAIAVCDEAQLHPAHLPPDITLPSLEPSTAEGSAARNPREQMIAALRRHAWQVSAAAAELAIPRATFYRRMQRYGIVAPNRADATKPNS
ncbi:MAG: sigma-54-dependent Fis family transcriptional regulator [Nevskia sp.]|jgi:transcriptional regulator of acetoin/glycerol metabolism|nr:sigma-54-dependent Fis family transcriptional regulator [Nevskia sp.]MCK9383797.1 sigma-54-dependent Fis family transcriptional regulator [Nevskia sp.]